MLTKMRSFLIWMAVYGVVVFFAFNRHSHSELFTYHAEISGDKAGYYVYLPAAFCYDFEARQFPAAIDEQTGRGFHLNLTTNKVETKYPYGVALLVAPFWGVARWLSTDKSGFSYAAHKSLNAAAATYFVLGLWLMFGALRRCFSRPVVIITLALFTFGTNLWYYAVIETGMSHVYSFFAFSLLLWLLSGASLPAWGQRDGLGGEIVAVAATLGLISVLRPLNLLLALPLLLWPANAVAKPGQWLSQGIEQVRGLLHWRSLATVITAITVCWVPQLMYYNYVHGSYFVYSYGHEGFPYLLAPRLAEVWFAPNNGSFLYNPILLLVLPGLWLLRRRSIWWSILAGCVWLVASYIYASWWAYALGCGYAGRGFVELYPVLAWPMATCVENGLANRRWLAGALCVLLVAYNMRLSLNFDRCFYGKTDWDWRAYRAIGQ